MTQQAVERTIGKLATDAEFRNRFFANPAAATSEAGLVLSGFELQALSVLSPAAVARFSKSVGPRIRRLCIDPANARRPAERVRGDDDDGTGSAT